MLLRRLAMEGTSQERIWILCPSYLDVESFTALRSRILEQARVAAGEIRFILVDDTAGTDPQLPELARFHDVQVMSVPFNLGHQRAIVFGLRELADQISDQDVVVTMDADGEDQPSDVPRLVRTLRESPDQRHRIALARRTKRRESVPFKALYFCFKIFFSALTGQVIQSGNFAAFRGWTVRNTLSHPYFDLCYSSSLATISPLISYIPCERGLRYAGQSRMGYFKLIMHGIRMLMPFIDRIAIRAIVGFSLLFVLSARGALASLAVLGAASGALPGWVLHRWSCSRSSRFAAWEPS